MVASGSNLLCCCQTCIMDDTDDGIDHGKEWKRSYDQITCLADEIDYQTVLFMLEPRDKTKTTLFLYELFVHRQTARY